MVDRFRLGRHLTAFTASLLVALNSANRLIAQETATAAPATQPQAEGSSAIVPAPRNIRNFAPDESLLSSSVAADKLDLRKVFEDLGQDATLWYQHVQTLANPFFGGRQPGTHGGDLAAEYIEFYFKLYGLEPAFPGDVHSLGAESTNAFSSYLQPFDFASPNPDVKVLTCSGSMNNQQLVEGTDFAVLGNSASGTVAGPLTFVGYGIADGQDGYTSFEKDTDLTGRVAILLRYEPLDENGKSQWSPSRFSRHSGIALKMKNVADRHAAGIILVNPPGAVDGKTGLESIKESGRFGKRMDVPVVQVTPEVADRILSQSDPEKRGLEVLRHLADKAEIKSVNLDSAVKVSFAAELQVKDRLATQNVAAVLRGKGNLADQWIVIGGHFDHLGYGYTGTMSGTNIGKLHPGADDNASGTAGVLIAARRLVQGYQKAGDGANLRSIVFIAFTGEEAGLLGSKYFVDHSPIPAESTSLMINMDMIGRLRSDNLLVQGANTAEGLSDLLKPHYQSSGLKISVMPGGRGPSDHSNFYAKDIPVLFLFTGEHAEYHQPTDYAYTVNPAGAIKVIELLEAIVMDVSSRPEQLKFATSTQQAEGGGPARRTASKVRLGIQPAYNAELDSGVMVDSVGEGTSAADAGILAGDILLEWNGEELSGGQKLFEFLGKAEPGDKAKLTVKRGDKTITVEVTLKARTEE